MKRFALIGLVLMLTATTAFSNKKSDAKAEPAKASVASILAGKVVDTQTGEELVGVAVKLAGTDRVCYTDLNGSFFFNGLTNGAYQVEVELISYQKVQTKKIQVSGNEMHELNLKLMPLN
jgi:YbbR domain-containing protein